MVKFNCSDRFIPKAFWRVFKCESRFHPPPPPLFFLKAVLNSLRGYFHLSLVLHIRSHLCSRYGWQLISLRLSCSRTHQASCLFSLGELMIKVHVSYDNISWCCINTRPPPPPHSVSPDYFAHKGRFILLHCHQVCFCVARG